MKSAIACFLVGLLAATIATPLKPEAPLLPRGVIEDLINGTIMAIISNLPEPIKIDAISIPLPGNGLEGSANFTNLFVSGIRDLEIREMHVDIFKLDMTFTAALPLVIVNSDYSLDVVLAELLPLYGVGKANIDTTEIIIAGSGKANLTGGISLANVKVTITLGSAVFDIHGFLNNEDFSLILSSILNDVVCKFINEHQDLVSSILSPIIQIVLNLILAGGGGTTAVAPTTLPPPTSAPAV